MKVTVKYWGQIKQSTGKTSEAIELADGATVRDLVERLLDFYGEALRAHVVRAEGASRQSVLLAVGEEQVEWDAPRKLEDGDVVTFLPPIAGGAR